MRAIANTTVISNLASVRRLDVLHTLLGRLYISMDVYAEIHEGLSEGYEFYAGIDQQVHPLTRNGWLRLTTLSNDEELRVFGGLPTTLHRGESSCLAIAIVRGWAFLTDDAHARRLAREQGVLVSGTLGVLIQAIKVGLLSLEVANEVLGQMIDRGYRTPSHDLADLI